MKTNIQSLYTKRLLGVVGLTFLAVPLLAQPPMPPPPVAPPPPPVIIQTPAPVPVPAPGVSVTIGVPETYVWDGYEYVGVVGDQYYYLGAGDVWLPLGGDRLARFHHWEGDHHDWRTHTINNDRYWRDEHGHDYTDWHHHHGH